MDGGFTGAHLLRVRPLHSVEVAVFFFIDIFLPEYCMIDCLFSTSDTILYFILFYFFFYCYLASLLAASFLCGYICMCVCVNICVCVLSFWEGPHISLKEKQWYFFSGNLFSFYKQVNAVWQAIQLFLFFSNLYCTSNLEQVKIFFSLSFFLFSTHKGIYKLKWIYSPKHSWPKSLLTAHPLRLKFNSPCN